MLVWTQTIPGISEKPVGSLWNNLLEKDRRGQIVLSFLPVTLLVAIVLSKPIFLRPVAPAVLLLFLGVTLSSKFFNVVIKDFTFDLEPAAFLAGLIVVGPVWSVVIAFVGIIFYESFITRTLLEPEKFWMNGFNIENTLVSSGSAAIVYGFFLAPLSGLPSTNYLVFFLLLCVSGFILISINQLMVSVYFAVLDRVTLTEVLKRNSLFYGDVMFVTLANLMFVTLTPIGFLFGILFEYFPAFVLVLIPLLVALYYLPKLLFQIKQETGDALEAVGDLLNERHDNRDQAKRVSRCARIIAQEMGLRPEEVDACAQAAQIYDIGEIAVPDFVLRKKGELSKDEYAQVQEHVRVIPRLFPDMGCFGRAARVAMLHHEHYDGSGYPLGLRGHEIPIEARVMAVADAWDAMTSSRSYRERYSESAALQILLDGAGIQWDPRVVQALMKGYEKGTIGGKDRQAA